MNGAKIAVPPRQAMSASLRSSSSSLAFWMGLVRK
jgi:hypothetical protein